MLRKKKKELTKTKNFQLGATNNKIIRKKTYKTKCRRLNHVCMQIYEWLLGLLTFFI